MSHTWPMYFQLSDLCFVTHLTCALWTDSCTMNYLSCIFLHYFTVLCSVPDKHWDSCIVNYMTCAEVWWTTRFAYCALFDLRFENYLTCILCVIWPLCWTLFDLWSMHYLIFVLYSLLQTKVTKRAVCTSYLFNRLTTTYSQKWTALNMKQIDI